MVSISHSLSSHRAIRDRILALEPSLDEETLADTLEVSTPESFCITRPERKCTTGGVGVLAHSRSASAARMRICAVAPSGQAAQRRAGGAGLDGEGRAPRYH